jgi:hypothetical protein
MRLNRFQAVVLADEAIVVEGFQQIESGMRSARATRVSHQASSTRRS